MLKISNYTITEKIYKSAETLVYRGYRTQDKRPVIIKTLQGEYPPPERVAQFHHEYTISKGLNLPGVVKCYGLLRHKNSWVLVFEDNQSDSLRHILASQQRFSPKEKGLDGIFAFLHFALQLADSLGELHAHRIIHKDIKPANLIVNLKTELVKITDLSIASRLSFESQALTNPNLLEGTLLYMSPEQTGRMNRAIDYRTDFYSLGAVFYEMLVGSPPFQSDDAMELVHCHIAKQPISPHTINADIPRALSNIVMKLLAKTAEERYQSAKGLKADLLICQQQLQASGKIQPFICGQHDIVERFQIPQKLYGREPEIETLLASFEKVVQGNREMMLVSGYSGIGKSVLVQEIYKPITQQRGYFIAGKFDQLQRDIPYSAIVTAFSSMVQQLLTETDAQLKKWREKLQTAFGNNGQIIIEVIPEVELIVGKQPPVQTLMPAESQNRFNLVLQKFIRVFCQPEHPLVLFLDDLQWVDSASLKLIQMLVTDPDIHYLYLIGAYRDNEVSPVHPLMLTLEAINQTDTVINKIVLQPLGLTHLNCLIADALSSSEQRAKPLSELVFQKTQGNPFFATQFLKSLYEDGLLEYVPPPVDKVADSHGGWQCDISKVKALTASEDVVEFIAAQLQKLPQQTIAVLKLAACIGHQFDLATLSLVYEKSAPATAADLWQALLDGLILPTSQVHKFFQDSETTELATDDLALPSSGESVDYKFLHDRVQQAAYSLIPETDRKATHLKIGQLLLKNTPEETLEDKLFQIVNQLNTGAELITSQAEKTELARLNLIAGRKAKASTAYESALNELKLGLSLLAADCWHTQYDLTLNLSVEAAEAAYLYTDFEQMEQLAQAVLQNARTLLDKIKAYEVKIQACYAQNQLLEAVNTALFVLKRLGINLPNKPTELNIILGFLRTKWVLVGKKTDKLIDLPTMTQPEKLAAMHLLSSVISAVFIATPNLFPLIVFNQVSLSVKYGNAPASCFAYAAYGFILCGIVGDIEAGYQFGQLALNLLERLNAKEFKAKTMLFAHSGTRHWKEPLTDILDSMLDGYQSGLESGDLEYAAILAQMYGFYSHSVGKELSTLEPEMASYSHVISQLKQESMFRLNQLYRQSVLNLMGKTDNPCQLIGEAYNEEKMLVFYTETNDINALFELHFNKVFLFYQFNEFRQAVETAALAEKYIEAPIRALLLFAIYCFYTSLAQLAVCVDAPKSEQKRLLKKVAASQKQMKKWAHYAPSNFQHKYDLVEAEKARVLGQTSLAMKYYESAIKGALQHGYLQEEALAYERAAEFYRALGYDKIALTYFSEAHYYYACWGAQAKVNDLEARYPQLTINATAPTRSNPTTPTAAITTQTGTLSSRTRTMTASSLDLATVIKASQAFSGEMVLEQLIRKMMQIVIENAGAQTGFLILDKQGQFWIEAEIRTELETLIKHVGKQSHNDNAFSETLLASALNDKRHAQNQPIMCLHSLRLEEAVHPESGDPLVPINLINYALRTKEPLTVNDAAQKGLFTTDPYLVQLQPKSLLCMPMVYHGQLIGALYLENNLMPEAFTTERLILIKLLSTQIAISLKNALLYQENEQARLAAESANRAKSSFLANMSHELRTPLNAIIGYSDMMLEDAEDAEDMSCQDFVPDLNNIQTAAKQLLGIISDVLDLSKIEAEKVEINPTTFDVASVVNDVITVIQPLLADNQLEVNCPPETGTLYADAPKIQLILQNLLNNAAKFTQQGKITLSVTRTPEWMNFEIADTGIGIAAEQLKHIFEPFNQADNSYTREYGGTGLGLTICEHYCQMMGGHITVISELNKGSVFTVQLPLSTE
jgi:predicted ATPase/signal transduction histidine kinase